MTRRRLILSCAAVLGVLACSGLTPTPVPPDKASYVGTWTGSGTTLSISREGTVEWESKQGGQSKSINGPIQEWTDHGFIVGVFGITTTFSVEKEPKEVDGRWEMTVDGVTLQRQ